MTPTIERISAVTFRVVNMTESVRFYRDVLGMELLCKSQTNHILGRARVLC